MFTYWYGSKENHITITENTIIDVFIPHILLMSNDANIPFEFKGLQFTIQITIHYEYQQQLNVACARIYIPDNLSVLWVIKHIMYHQTLL